MYDIMLDLETMGNGAGAAIVAIGAVECDLPSGEIGSTFYRVIDLHGQEDIRDIDPGTLYWWLKQSKGARESLLIDGKVEAGLFPAMFNRWIDSLEVPKEKLRLWGNGATFDNTILVDYYRSYRYQFPIDFKNHRDMRTLVGFYPRQLLSDYYRNAVRVGTHHNALDDAKFQVKMCAHILQELGVEEMY